jgi:DNA-binding response OmpR family regulator
MNETGDSVKPIQGHPNVMVVDDEESIRNATADLLISEGIEIITADGAEQCLLHLRAGFRGVILMDVNMPVTNGWETIREIERVGMLDGNIVTMLTGNDVPDQQMEGLQEIVIDYITKPFEPSELLASVRRYLGYLEHLHEKS